MTIIEATVALGDESWDFKLEFSEGLDPRIAKQHALRAMSDALSYEAEKRFQERKEALNES